MQIGGGKRPRLQPDIRRTANRIEDARKVAWSMLAIANLDQQDAITVIAEGGAERGDPIAGARSEVAQVIIRRRRRTGSWRQRQCATRG
jgi:hypothetical protein